MDIIKHAYAIVFLCLIHEDNAHLVVAKPIKMLGIIKNGLNPFSNIKITGKNNNQVSPSVISDSSVSR